MLWIWIFKSRWDYSNWQHGKIWSLKIGKWWWMHFVAFSSHIPYWICMNHWDENATKMFWHFKEDDFYLSSILHSKNALIVWLDLTFIIFIITCCNAMSQIQTPSIVVIVGNSVSFSFLPRFHPSCPSIPLICVLCAVCACMEEKVVV